MVRNIILISIVFYTTSCKKNEVEEQLEIFGCMDSSSVDYNSLATIDDGSCFYFGCTDILAINYDSVATVDDGNCLYQESIVDGYELFWNDEFNQDSLNMNFWNIEKWWEGAFNEESQRYVNSRENITIINGKLYIRAKKDFPFDPNNPSYSSGRINTKGKVELKYGYWEIRAKLPQGIGTWPAIWMLNSKIDSVGWPYCGEIDIMEHVGFDPNKVFFSIHNANLYGDVHGTSQQGVYELNTLETSFHNYAIEWGDSFIRGYINGTLYFDYSKNSTSFNDWPYDNKFFLILNLAIGGAWGGIQGIDNSIFPASFIIEYVRLYTKQ
tara:strand:+ start:7302 stop:8276 length:975 start_codon:yes stop_codon:yes gene_type:complete